MTGVLTGFAIIGAVVLAGYVVGRLGVLGPHAPFVLSRIVFFVLSPCLLFTTLADADVHVLFSSLLVVSALTSLICFALYAVIAFGVWRVRIAQGAIGTATSGWVNANNMGLPVAVYVLGDPAYVAPVIMLQLIVFTPVLLTILDVSTSGRTSVGRVLSQPVRNPIIIGSVAGLVLSIFHDSIPDAGMPVFDAIMEPFRLVAAAAIPLVLIAFGMSLHGRRALAPGPSRREVLLSSSIKLVLMPLTAALLGRFAFDLDPASLFAVVVIAGLPAAQNVLNYAQRYGRGELVARDTVLISTVGALPVLLVVAALLGPG